MNDQLALLLIGAGIALVSSVITTLLTSEIENKRRQKTRVSEQMDKIMELTGESMMLQGILKFEESGDYSSTDKREILQQHRAYLANRGYREKTGGTTPPSYTIGELQMMNEYYSQELSLISEQRYQELEDEIARLKETLQQFQPKREQPE